MISYLSGIVHDKDTDCLTLGVVGVGYQVYVPVSTLAKVSVNQNLEVFIHTHVREDALNLYGFLSKAELNLFKMLLNVSGVGPKIALCVIDRGVESVTGAIMKADAGFFTIVPRLGKKNAQKIIIELKSKLGSMAELDLAGKDDNTSDTIEALLSMGYTRAEAIAAIRKIPVEIQSVEERIRYALKQMKHV